VLYETGQYIQYNTTTTLSSNCGWTNSTLTHTNVDFYPTITFSFKTGPNTTDIENIRLWIGLFSASPMNSDDPPAHLAAVRYSTATDGTAFFRTCTKDGSTLNTNTSAVAVASDTRYVVKIVCTPTEIKFYINNELAGTHDSNLPTSSMNYFLALQNRLAGTERSLCISGVRCIQR
jgi:hypothetical protein